MCIAALVFFLIPGALLAIYLDADDPANAIILALGTQYLFVAALFQVFDGTQAVTAGLLRGLRDTKVPMVIAVAGYWAIGFTAAAWLGLFSPLEGLGVWIGLAVGLVVVACALLLRWSRRDVRGLLPA